MFLIRKLRDTATIPTVSYDSAGTDLYASDEVTILGGETAMVPTGITTAFPKDLVALIWDRSGMGKKGIHVFGGVIDSDYRGEWFILLHNSNDHMFTVNQGDRIAQVVFQQFTRPDFVDVTDNVTELEFEKLDSTRGVSGFSSTGA